jgi:hypothetical protein
VQTGVPDNGLDEPLLYAIFYALYRDGHAFFRAKLRKTMGRLMKDFAGFAHRNFLIAPVLDCLFKILEKHINHHDIERKLFRDLLLPLHASNKYQFWDRQIPMLRPLHKPLCKVLELFCANNRLRESAENQNSMMDVNEGSPNRRGDKYRDSFAVVEVMKACIRFWPPPTESNTPKEILLLQEMSMFLKFVDHNLFEKELIHLLLPKFV